MIKKLSFQDVRALAKIHVLTLPDDLLPSLGRSYLERCFFPHTLNSFSTVALGAYTETHELCAFAIFVKSAPQFTSTLLKSSTFYLIGLCIKKLITTRRFINKIIGFMQPVKRIIDSGYTLDNCPEIYVIATALEHQKKGYGSALIKEGLTQLQQLNYQACIVKTSSENAKQFYMNFGFIPIGKEYRGKRVFDILQIVLS